MYYFYRLFSRRCDRDGNTFHRCVYARNLKFHLLTIKLLRFISKDVSLMSKHSKRRTKTYYVIAYNFHLLQYNNTIGAIYYIIFIFMRASLRFDEPELRLGYVKYS